MQTWRVLVGDVREQLAKLPAASVQTCVTSPPYWGLRDYGMVGQLGVEQTPMAYVAAMVAVFDGVRRVLRDDGTLWVNLGDSHQNAKGQARGVDPKQPARRHGLRPNDVSIPGLKPKDLVGIPWMVAFALRDAGWYLRLDIVWSKPNPMPESVQDRPTKAHEYIFLLSKSKRYRYDADAIKEPHATGDRPDKWEARTYDGKGPSTDDGRRNGNVRAYTMDPNGRNKRSVWTVATHPYPGAHFATYPEELIEPCVKAGSRIGDTVLDPFTGSGTTGAVALKHGRSFVGIELNPAYAEMARRRIGSVSPLFAEEQSA